MTIMMLFYIHHRIKPRYHPIFYNLVINLIIEMSKATILLKMVQGPNKFLYLLDPPRTVLLNIDKIDINICYRLQEINMFY